MVCRRSSGELGMPLMCLGVFFECSSFGRDPGSVFVCSACTITSIPLFNVLYTDWSLGLGGIEACSRLGGRWSWRLSFRAGLGRGSTTCRPSAWVCFPCRWRSRETLKMSDSAEMWCGKGRLFSDSALGVEVPFGACFWAPSSARIVSRRDSMPATAPESREPHREDCLLIF